jgi:glycosyltransferase involved in cell wall biosynthesis
MTEPVSVLIPARNEEQNIRVTLEAVLANRGVNFEIIVLDDHSTDGTAGIVSGLAAQDPRVRLAPCRWTVKRSRRSCRAR